MPSQPIGLQPTADSEGTVQREIGSLVDELLAQLYRAFARRADGLDLTLLQGTALHALSSPMPMNVFASTLSLEGSTVTGLADRLEARGLVERRPDPSDRRVKLLALTEAGEEVRAMLDDGLAVEVLGLDRVDGDDLVTFRDGLRALLHP